MPSVRRTASPPAPFSLRQFLKGRLVRWEHMEEASADRQLRLVVSFRYTHTSHDRLPTCQTCRSECQDGYRSLNLEWDDSGRTEYVDAMCVQCFEYFERETRDK